MISTWVVCTACFKGACNCKSFCCVQIKFKRPETSLTWAIHPTAFSTAFICCQICNEVSWKLSERYRLNSVLVSKFTTTKPRRAHKENQQKETDSMKKFTTLHFLKRKERNEPWSHHSEKIHVQSWYQDRRKATQPSVKNSVCSKVKKTEISPTKQTYIINTQNPNQGTGRVQNLGKGTKTKRLKQWRQEHKPTGNNIWHWLLNTVKEKYKNSSSKNVVVLWNITKTFTNSKMKYNFQRKLFIFS